MRKENITKLILVGTMAVGLTFGTVGQADAASKYTTNTVSECKFSSFFTSTSVFSFWKKVPQYVDCKTSKVKSISDSIWRR
ncbi:hypothetical protein [Niallia taxi]|uniref:hypothetical protein n=1 Tax=Niallia taxi TaxID=2499688 RepID=UPI0015F432CD|nr:hypothetical protein [Niallia taxi]